MKKKYLALFLLFFSFGVSAKEIKVKGTYTNVNVRSSAGATYKVRGQISYLNGNFTLKGYVKGNSACSNLWANIDYYGDDSYVCSTFTEEIVPDQSFEEQIKNFPESYKSSLRQLHAKYPTWKFVKVDTYTDWNNALNEQVDRSLYYINGTHSRGLLRLDGEYFNPLTDYYKPNGSRWFYPSKETIAYYLDPRNFLTEQHIFAFESLQFSNHHTVEGVKQIAKPGTYLSQFADIIYKASKDFNLSAYYATSHAIQENGYEKNDNTSGLTKSSNNNKAGWYNFYNIGAHDSGDNKVLNGINYAESQNWNTPEKSIRGGIEFIQSGYIKANQHTQYSIKFNVHYNRTKGTWHQYMQNIQAPYSTALTSFNTFKNNGHLNLNHTFYIPVFKGMPNKTVLPNNKNPNNYLKNISINGQTLSGFNYDKYEYEYPVSNLVANINISATTASTVAKLEGVGNISIINKDKIVVTGISEQGTKRNYTINLKKFTVDNSGINIEDEIKKANYTINNNFLKNIGKNQDRLAFQNKFNNMVVSVNNNNKFIGTDSLITFNTGNETKKLRAIVYGDVNGDGMIDIVDLSMLQHQLVKNNVLKGNFKEAGNVNRDNTLDIVDLSALQMHLINKYQINQR